MMNTKNQNRVSNYKNEYSEKMMNSEEKAAAVAVMAGGGAATSTKIARF